MADQATLTCPYCGGTSTYTLTMQNGSQVQTCYSCSKSFRIKLSGGTVTGVVK